MLGEGVAVDRACLRSSLPALAASCDATFNSTDSSRLRVVMSSLIHACTRFDDDGGSVRRLRVIAGVARLYPELQRLSTQFSAATGIPIYFNFSTRIGSSGALIRSAMARPPPVVDSGDNTAGGADAFITTTSLLPNLDQGGKLLDVNGLVGDDGQLRWYEINKALREQMAVYGNKVVGIPVTTSPVFLFYHKPVFARDNLTVPVTWEQVLALAERYNGTDLNGNGVPGYGMCMTPPDCFVDGTILQWILGSFVQTQGYSQGLILDPETLADLANSSAMAEALTIMKRLRRVGPLSGNCAVFEDEAYLEGRCLLSITTPTTFKAAYSPEKPARFAAMRGRMGMAPFPGSTRVLDRASGNLTDCDAARCPMARVYINDTSGVRRPVNQPTPSANVVVLINSQSTVKYQFYAYSHQLAALDAKAVKAWLQDASWKGRANKNNPRFYADVPADDSGPFAAIRKAIIDAINKAERKKRQKGKKCALVKMYAIFTKTGGFHAPHGDGSRGGMAGYKLRYVMKVGGTGKTGRIHLKMKGEEEMAYEYEAAYSMDAATGSSPNKHRVAHKAKMSAARKGKKHTAAHKAKISAAMKGKKHTAAHKAKISAAMKGNTNRMKKR